MSLFETLGSVFTQKDLKKSIDEMFKEERVIEPQDIKDVYLRASGIVDVCPRLECLVSKLKMRIVRKIDAKLGRTFRFGRAWERMFRDDVLGPQGIVIGKWKCLRCEDMPAEVAGKPRYSRPSTCGACGYSKMEFFEEKAINHEARVMGHNDGFLYWNNDYVILELKTANAYNYAGLKLRPSENHVGQVQVYMAMHGYKTAVIIYFNKDTSEMAYHWIVFDEQVANSLLNKGRSVRIYAEGGPLPGRLCLSKSCVRAVKCPVVDACFGDVL